MSDTFTLRVKDYFLARTHQWVTAIQLERIGGRQAWRTRVSDCRKEHKMRIENRLRTIVEPDGRQWRLREYRYVPDRWTESATSSPDGFGAVVSAEERARA